MVKWLCKYEFLFSEVGMKEHFFINFVVCSRSVAQTKMNVSGNPSKADPFTFSLH